jgi:hypothetical protein
MKKQDSHEAPAALAARLQRGEKLNTRELLRLMDALIAKDAERRD